MAEAALVLPRVHGNAAGRRKRAHRFPHVRQADAADNGAACLAMVTRYFGGAVSPARLRELVDSVSESSNLRSLCRGAERLGLAARAVRATIDDLSQMPLPAIVQWRDDQWVVLYKVEGQHLYVGDPATRLQRIPLAEAEASWTGGAVLFDYAADLEQQPGSRAGMSWLWRFVKPFSSTLWRGVGLALFASALEMVFPVFTQIVVDRVLVDQDTGLLHMLALAMGGVLIFRFLAIYVQRYLLSFAAVHIDAATLDFLTRKLLALPVSYFRMRRTGDLQRRLEGIHEVRQFLVENGIGGLSAATQLLAALALMLVYSPLLTFVFLSTVPLYAFVMRHSAHRLQPLFASLEAAFGRYHSHQIDAIKGIETVKALGAEAALRERMLEQFHRIGRRIFSADLTVIGYEGAVRSVGFLSMILFLWFGAQQVMSGQITIGGLVAFNTLVAFANSPIATLLGLWDNYQQSFVLFERMNDVFDQEPEQGRDHSQLLPVRRLSGKITLRNLSLRYGTPDAPAILRGITLDVEPGQTVAIVGRSGSGKTTLVKCLAGLVEPTGGAIMYDGVALNRLNYRDLRRQIGFVLQDTHLFDDTIARNISLGSGEPDMDRTLWAARMAHAEQFIMQLPLGFETQIGETGVALSGGQRQRIAIARAIYHQPPVLILDEATSFLDAEAERAVQDSMNDLLQSRTCIVIAHRLSTIRDADRIVVLDHGTIVEQGTHAELIRRQGLYSYLVSQQLEL